MENRAAEIHAGLKHPVIDGDGHWMEPIPVFLEYLSEVGGPESVDQMRALWRARDAWYRATWPERQHHRLRRAIWWGVTSNTLDKATALLPALLNERLPELGIDFALIYPSFGLTINAHGPGRTAPGRGPRLQHDDGRHVRAVCRKVCAGSDHARPYAGEAIEELEYAVGKRVSKRSCCGETRSGRSPARRKASIRRRLHGTATPSPSTAPMTTSRSGSAASTSAWP